MINRILFFLLFPYLSFHAYADSQAVGGWLGWYELFGRTIAFEDVDGWRFFDF